MCLTSSFYHPRKFHSSSHSRSCFSSVSLPTLKEKMHLVRQRVLTHRATASFQGGSIQFISHSLSQILRSLNHLTLNVFTKEYFYDTQRNKQCAKGVNLCSGHGLKRMVNGHKHLWEPKSLSPQKSMLFKADRKLWAGHQRHFFSKGTQVIRGRAWGHPLINPIYSFHSRRKSQKR